MLEALVHESVWRGVSCSDAPGSWLTDGQTLQGPPEFQGPLPRHQLVDLRSKPGRAASVATPTLPFRPLFTFACSWVCLGDKQKVFCNRLSHWSGSTWRFPIIRLSPDAAGTSRLILAAELTDNDVADASAFPNLLSKTEGKINRFTADGAYDRREVYETAGKRGAYVVVPPQRGAVISGHPVLRTRDRHIRRIAKVGRAQWRREKGQHRQARVENTFYRYKRIIGPGLRARDPMAQRNEMLAACNLLN